MRCMLAHMLTGEMKAFHIALSDRLAERFKLRSVSGRIGPHFTIKAPFEVDDEAQLAEIERIVAAYAGKESAKQYTLGGVDHFRGRVVYMDARAPKQTHMLLRRLQDQLRNISWLRFSKSEFPITLHATLCRPKHPQQTKEIFTYLGKEKLPKFSGQLDSIALLERGADRWQVYRHFQFSETIDT